MLLLASVLWATAVVTAPVVASTAAPRSPSLLASIAVYGLGAFVCHQRDERSFHTAQLRWPVCARCAGLYLSAGVGALVVLLFRTRWTLPAAARGGLPGILLLAAAPTCASWGAEQLGLIAPGNLMRAALSVPLGMAVVVLVAHASWSAGAPKQLR
jgi:uncharacterized membrane protein